MNAPVAPAAVVERQRFLGGSDAAGVLGVSPWDTPLDIFLKKTEPARGGEIDPAKERLFRWGKLLEPVVIKHLRADYAVTVKKVSTARRPNRYQDPEHPFLAAEIDFEWRVTRNLVEEYGLDPALYGTIQNGEIKTVHQFAAAKFGEAETEDVPIEYAAQAMHGLMVTGRKLCMFGVLTGSRDVTIYWIKRDEETISAMRAQLVAFWREHVLAGVPPAPRNLPDVMKLFRKAPASVTEASPEMAALIPELDRAKAARDAAEDRECEVKFEIGRFMLGEQGVALANGGKLEPGPEATPGEHVLAMNGTPLLRVCLQQQSRLDGTRLAKERPEVVAEFQKPISFFTFQKPRKGKRP